MKPQINNSSSRLERFKVFGKAPLAAGNTSVREAPRGISNLPAGERAAEGVYRTEEFISYGARYGEISFNDPIESASALMPFGAPSNPVFLDLETTGLSGGAGTYAFLIGLGFCEADGFRVVQLFKVGPQWEREWIGAVERELFGISGSYGFVTYNGKTFDIPLLSARYTLSRAVPSWGENRHLNLLMMTRHFYRGRISSCSLSCAESELLGVRRAAGDIPGRFIPELYREFLCTGYARPLSGVFYHNAMDIISLAALHGRIASLCVRENICGEDLLRCGDLWHKQGDGGEAEFFW